MLLGRKLLAAVAVLAGFWLGSAEAQTRPKLTAPADVKLERFMYVGNSFFYYNNGLPGHVGRLAAGVPAAERWAHRSTMITMGGSGFDWHDLESYFRPKAVGYYNFDANNNIVFNTRAKLYDAVVMMDCSQCPIHPQLGQVFTEYARKNSETARKHGAEPVLFMSWAYADKPEMTDQLAEAYTVAGNANNALVIPAGLAFARVVKERPELVLYQADKRHPTALGTYLAAATVYAALTGRSPEVNSYNADVAPDVARYLRAAAWAATQAYYNAPAR